MTCRPLTLCALLALSGALACTAIPNPLLNGDETGDGDGDGDSTGDGDGDGDATGDGDGDATGDGDGDSTGDGDGDTTGEECIDQDQDGYGEGCDLGPDCDDNDFNVHTVQGCADCSDNDMDGVWVGCDQYSDAKPGPDCDDNNQAVGIDDAVEICNGLAENCAGEIDNFPADQMCPPMGVDAPNVSPMGGWACNPPAPGVDGCEIVNCVEQYFDLNSDIHDGCECQGTIRTDSLAACSDAPQGFLGTLNDGQLASSVVGTIPEIDNGVGAGDEDWYSVDGSSSGSQFAQFVVSFDLNSGNDYRVEVYNSCNGLAQDSGITAEAPAYNNTIYIRVFRVQNNLTCNNYQLRVQRFSTP